MWSLIFVFIPLILDFVDAKYCAYEVEGETRFYTCSRSEYCCNFGCCVSPAFQFYQLWYYWLLVIFMFLLCSGGGWWYRCWLRGRFPESQSQLPRAAMAPSLQSRRSTVIRSTRSAAPVTVVQPPVPEVPGSTAAAQSQFQVARVSYSTSGDRLILHRLWKDARGGLHPLDSPPSYTTARADNAQPMSPGAATMLVDPYVLYGPPPSYESIMQQDQAGPSSTQSDTLSPGLVVSSPSAVESLDSCPSSQQISPMTPPSPASPQEQSPTSPMADITSDEDRGPPTSHQASQTVSSPIASPTNPVPL